jgi:hypothetical protein
MGVRSLKLTDKGRLEAVKLGDFFFWSLKAYIINVIGTPKEEIFRVQATLHGTE